MNHTLAAHKLERIYQLSEYLQDFLLRYIPIASRYVFEEISVLAVVHNDKHDFGGLIVRALVDAHQIGMG